MAWVEQSKKDAEQRFNHAKGQLLEQQQQLVIAKDKLTVAKQHYEAEQQKEEMRKALAISIHELEQLIPLVQDYKQLEQQIQAP